MDSTFNIKKLKYDIDQVLGHFGIRAVQSCAQLAHWLDVSVDTTYQLPELLEEKRRRLAWEGVMWNEEELKMHFLSFVFSFANIEISDKVKLFYERPIAATVQGKPLLVICDALLASYQGFNTPQKPYFFLQEFKKNKKSQDDAEGQMLVAMLIAQQLNEGENPIYGCYLHGKDWCFTTLYKNEYCFSKSYDATEPQELAQIIHILTNIKNIIDINNP